MKYPDTGSVRPMGDLAHVDVISKTVALEQKAGDTARAT